MQEMYTTDPGSLEIQLLELYGPLLTLQQLAQLLGRSPGGLRYSLMHPRDPHTQALKDCGRRLGHRRYYPARDVATIISSIVP